MVTDQQVRRLMMLLQQGLTKQAAADKAAMAVNTARKYRRSGKLPSECRPEHTWRTRDDPFGEAWEGIRERLQAEPRLQARTIFDMLQREHPGRFADGQLRTLQRRVRQWRCLSGPPAEVFFAQVHRPGVLCESDFTHTGKLGITVGGARFDHLLYHFVLTYSNWEHCTVCFSESFESLSAGLQNALWQLGGVPGEHRTDRLSSAVANTRNPEDFTRRYQGLLDHYRMAAQKTQAGHANENGDVEQRHRRFKEALDQALMLRGSRDFTDRSAYGAFLEELLGRLNAGRTARFAEELKLLRPLPDRRLDDCTRLAALVDSGSLIRVDSNVYSVSSRLIGQRVEVRQYTEHVEVWYAGRKVERLERLRGRRKHRVDYRHIIDWLVRKPGAFANYRYRDDLFPTSRFRMACDALHEAGPARADREYLRILELAARESESGVDDAIRHLLSTGEAITADAIKGLVLSGRDIPPPTEVEVQVPDLALYDELLSAAVEASR